MEYIKISEYRQESIDKTISKSLNDYVVSSIKKLEEDLIANDFSLTCRRINTNLFHSIGVWNVYGEIIYRITNTKIHYVTIYWNVTNQMSYPNFTIYKKFETCINSLERERVLKIKELELL